MDLGFSEAQQMLRRSAREFLETECPRGRIRQIEDTPEGWSADLWKQTADLGWLGLTMPEEYGGLGLTLLDQVVLFEELGRALVPGPFVETSVILPKLLLEVGSQSQRSDLLPAIAAGKRTFGLALAEEDASWNVADVQLTARPRGDAYVLEGTKLFIPYGGSVDTLLVAARTGDAPENLTLFLVDRGAPGLTITTLPSLTAASLAEARFRGVVTNEIVGPVNGGVGPLNRALNLGSLMLSAAMVGGGQAVLDMTIEYAKSRVAFGVPIGSFQAIQHKCVQMLNDLDGGRWTVYDAIWKIEQDLPGSDLAISVAKYLCAEGYRRICFEGHEIHAGVGFMVDYDLQLYYRRAKWSEQYLGNPVFHRERVADLALSAAV